MSPISLADLLAYDFSQFDRSDWLWRRCQSGSNLVVDDFVCQGQLTLIHSFSSGPNVLVVATSLSSKSRDLIVSWTHSQKIHLQYFSARRKSGTNFPLKTQSVQTDPCTVYGGKDLQRLINRSRGF